MHMAGRPDFFFRRVCGQKHVHQVHQVHRKFTRTRRLTQKAWVRTSA